MLRDHSLSNWADRRIPLGLGFATKELVTLGLLVVGCQAVSPYMLQASFTSRRKLGGFVR